MDQNPTTPPWHLAAATVLLACLGVGFIGFSGCRGSEIEVGSLPRSSAAPDAIGAELADPLGPLALNPTCYVDTDCAALVSAPCARASCNPVTKRCEAGTLPDLVACQGGGPCAAEAACLSGVCVALTVKTCDDDNPCTADDCDAQTGCVHKDKTLAPCSDGNPCTVGDRCIGGGCVALTNLCTCADDMDCAGLGGPCVSKMSCSAGACVTTGATAVDCDDGNPCTQDVCLAATGACTHAAVANNNPCDDGDICTLQDRCNQGSCVGTAKLACDSHDDTCATAACDPKLGCMPVASGQACDDGNACTQGDGCRAGVCGGTSTCGCNETADCVDQVTIPSCLGSVVCRAGRCEVNPDVVVPCGGSGQPCVINRCTPGGCKLTPAAAGAICEDGDACTRGDTCDSGGACRPGPALPCDDGVACTNDACIPSVGCVHGSGADGKACDDGLSCTVGDVCAGLVCVGKPTGCDDDDPCTTDFCAPAGQGCIHKALNPGASCDDGDACTLSERCVGGLCTAVKTLICDDGDPCSLDQCDGLGGCKYPANPGQKTCDDGDVCTDNDACVGGKCIGQGGGCACQTLTDCTAKEDGDLCNGTLVCVDHNCVIDPSTVVSCVDTVSPCVTVACQPNSGLCVEQSAGLGSACDDGDACTQGERCLVGGACGGGKVISCDDGDGCTADSCKSGQGCVHAVVATGLGVPCEDGNPCTQGDVCGGGGCVSGKNTCQCGKDADCVAFDDDNICNGVLRCNQGACVSDGIVVTCDLGKDGPCVEVACQPKTGQCAAVALPDGATCAGVPGGVVGVCAGGQCSKP